MLPHAPLSHTHPATAAAAAQPRTALRIPFFINLPLCPVENHPINMRDSVLNLSVDTKPKLKKAPVIFKGPLVNPRAVVAVPQFLAEITGLTGLSEAA
jgi:hypothetical protein